MARRLAFTWVFNVVALFVATWLLSGLSYGREWWAVLVAGAVLTLANIFLRPVLAVLSIPLIIATLGLFYLLIDVFTLYLTHWIVPQFTIASFWWAVLAAMIVGAVNWLLALLFGRPSRKPRAVVWLARQGWRAWRWLMSLAPPASDGRSPRPRGR